MFKNILVPLDSSKLSELSLEYINKVAAASGRTEVVLLIVMEPVSHLTYAYSGLPEDDKLKYENKSRDHAQKYIDKVADRLKKAGINARGEVVWGSPADEILRYIEENDIDLVIMSTHGRSGIQRWALGSVADKVIRGSTAPVLIISPHGLRTKPGGRKKGKNLKR